MPGVTTRNRLAKRASFGVITLLIGLPRDDHRHHDGLARAGGHLQRHARQPVVVQLVLGFEPAPVVGGAVAAGDLGEEDRRLRRLALAEQHRLVAVRRPGSPVGQQLAGVRGDAVPVAGTPPLDLAADVVDQRVLLAPLARDVEVEGLLSTLAPLPADRHGDEGLARPAACQETRRSGRSARSRSGPRAGRTAS